jgi:hypothetical protein
MTTHQLIADLPFQWVITTNWDLLLEDAMRHQGKKAVRVIGDPDVAYLDASKVGLVKLHGSVEQKDSMVVTLDDYYEVFARSPEVTNLVRSHFASKTILFLGYGLADEDFRRLYNEVVQNVGAPKRRAYAVQLDPDEFTTSYWKLKNLEVIPADAGDFLQALALQVQDLSESNRSSTTA